MEYLSKTNTEVWSELDAGAEQRRLKEIRVGKGWTLCRYKGARRASLKLEVGDEREILGVEFLNVKRIERSLSGFCEGPKSNNNS
jgi:hypothetical protein